jgi:chemotaxis protein methyltransferase CheR
MTATRAEPKIPELSERQFALLCEIAKTQAGLMISSSKRQMIQSRLTRHLRELRRTDFDAFLKDIVSEKSGPLTNGLISVLTTNVSSFFREKHHFESLERDLLPQMLKKARAGGRVRIWSAGCSSGQEPYSIAILLLKRVPDIASLDIKILGTDIDRKIISRARAALYSNDEANTLSDTDRKVFFETSANDSHGNKIIGQAANLVSIKPLNLLKDWPMKHQFDAVFCRNVLIYFDAETQQTLWPRFNSVLNDGGYLFLGHSERIQNSESFGFFPCGVTTYQKNGAGKAHNRTLKG